MTRVRIRKTGEVLYLRGGAPWKEGDEFQAACFPVEPPQPRQELFMDGKTTVITCRRGFTGGPPHQEASRTFRYDPALHELLP